MNYGENKSVNDAMDSGLAMGAQAPAAAAPIGAASGLPQVTPITAPSETPERGVTYGMPFGDGPGPEVVPLPQGLSMQEDPARQIIRALYQQNPRNEDLRYMVEIMDAQEQVQ
jgi:hypothetical protein